MVRARVSGRLSSGLVVALALVFVFQSAAVPGGVLANGTSPSPRTEQPLENPSQDTSPSPVADEPAEPTEERVEVEELRTETSRTFDNGDGTFTDEIAPFPIHYDADRDRETQGDWEPIELGFAEVEAARGDATPVRAMSDAAPVSVEVADSDDPDGFLSLSAGDVRISFSFQTDSLAEHLDGSERTSIEPTLDGPAADYPDVAPGIDLRVLATAIGAKSFLVLNDQPKANSFAFDVDAPGLTLELAKDGSVALLDEAGERVGSIPVPYLVDSSEYEGRGGGAFSDTVGLELAGELGSYVLTIVVEPEYLESATYPVYVDPTANIGTGSDAYGDAFVSAKYATMNFQDYQRPDSPYYHELWLGTDPSDSTNVNYVYMKFNLSSSTYTDTTIDLARLRFHPYHQWYNAPTAVRSWVDRVNGSWTESGLTWNNKPGSTNLGYVDTVKATTAYFTVTSTVQSWVNGSVTNHGLKIHQNGNNYTYWKRLIASEQGGSYPPMLIVDYHRPVGTPSSPISSAWTKSRTLAWTYSDANGAGQSHYQVQVDNNSDFSSLLSQSGTVASSTKQWDTPSGVSLTNGTTYYWRVKVKNGTGWSNWSSGAAFKWDAAAASFTSVVVDGAITAADPNYYDLGNGTFTIKIRGSDANSGIKLTYLRLYNATNEMRVQHDWSVGGTHCNEFDASTLVDATACSESYNSGGTREVTFTVVGLNQNASFDIHYYFTDYAGNTVGYTDTGKNLHFDATAPTGSISSPTVSATIGGTVNIVGSASDANFHQYELHYESAAFPGTWTSIGTNPRTSPVTNGTLGSWDTTTVPDGAYSIRLIVKDKARVSSGFTTVTRAVTVDNTVPVAVIEAPTEDRLFDGVVEITGTASGDTNFTNYTLHYGVGCSSPSSWNDIGSNPYLTPVESGTLGSWDTAGLQGPHTLRLVANRSGGGPTIATICVEIGSSLGVQAQHTYERWDLGGGDELAVNVATGNAVVSHPLVTLPHRGGSLPLSLTYNSLGADNLGLGIGWQLNLQRRLLLNSNDTVTFVDADGARHLFTDPQISGTVTTYARPPSTYASLSKDVSLPVEFALTYRDGTIDRFDIAGAGGRLERSIDRHGNAIVLTYGTANQIDQVTDPASRSIDFTWDGSGRLTSITDWAYIDTNGVIQASTSGSRREYRFFHEAGQLAGWSEPLNTGGSCPTGGSYMTCLAYADGVLSAITKTQTVTTLGSGTLGTTSRSITTEMTYGDNRVASVTDAEQAAQTEPASTVFTWDDADSVTVARPTTTTGYELVVGDDPYARVISVLRYLDPATPIERRITWHSGFPVEPASVTDNYGAALGTPARTVTYTYQPGSQGLVSKIVEPMTASTNRWTEHIYNANNDVTETTVSQDGLTSLRAVTRFCYDSGCTLTGDGPVLLGKVENFASGGPSDNETNVQTDYSYDSFGQLEGMTRHNRSSSGAVLDDREDRFTYDANGNLTAEIINYVNGTVTGGDDVTPNATTLARTDLTTAHAYDTAGNLTSSADPRLAILAVGGSPGADDYITRWTFDALNRRLSETTPTTPGNADQQHATTTYDESGKSRAAADLGGLSKALEYDRAARAVRAFEDPAGSDPAIVTAITTYDGDGRPLSSRDRRQVLDAGLGASEMTYDGLGRPVLSIEAAGTTDESLTEMAYDALGRRTHYVVGGQSTAYGHDIGGRVTHTDDGFTCTEDVFDYEGRTLSTTYGLAGSTCSSTGDEFTVTQTFDGLGRLTRQEESGLRPVDDVFDSVGNRLHSAPITQAPSGGTESVASDYVFNLLDHVIEETRTEGSVSRTSKITYDAVGNAVDRCLWQAGAVVGSCPTGSNPPYQVNTATYDARNQRLTLTDGATNQTTVYDPDHNYQPAAVYTPVAAGVELQTLYGYDERHRLISSATQQCMISSSHACSSTVPLGSSAYAYDESHNRVHVSESADGSISTDWFYCYDARNQLTARNTGAGCDISSDETYTYDASGNRLTAIDAAGTRTFGYTAEGQYAGATHDASGRFGEWNGWSFTAYDANGRLTEACVEPCGTSDLRLTFTYNADGLRTGTTETVGTTSTDTELRYDNGRISAEYVDGVLARSYVTDESGAIVKMVVPSGQPNPGTYLVTWNGHGDAINLLHLSGGTVTLANSFTYDTWGVAAVDSHNGFGDLGFRFRYVGQFGVADDAVLGMPILLMGARHYAPAIGRFIQPDPSRAETNHYSYAGNSPVSAVDPHGLAYASLESVPIKNPKGLRGLIRIAMFISAAQVCPVSGICLSGDNRSFVTGSYCYRSRVCIELDFTGKRVRALANPSCGSAYQTKTKKWYYACVNAHDINGFFSPNQLKVGESSNGQVSIWWTMAQSRYPNVFPGMSIDGGFRFTPSLGGGSWSFAWDGYPSAEIHAHWGGKVYSLLRKKEGSFWNLQPFLGDGTYAGRFP